MKKEELARLRQEYMDELKRFCSGINFGPYPTEGEFEYLMSLVPDSMIVDNVENDIPPIRTIEELVYYNIVCA